MTKTISAKKTKFFIFSLRRNLSGIAFSVAVMFIMMLIIVNPAIFSASTISGMKLFFYSVLPGLFPFMFLTKLLTELGTAFKASQKLNGVSRKLFDTPGVSLYCFFMSILSGYPIGAKIIADLNQKNLISDDDAKKMSIFCTTSGPIFVIGAVGVGMLKSFKLGVIIYISHILSSLICGLTFNLISRKKSHQITPLPASFATQENIVSKCLSDTISSLFLVGGYITIFYLLTEVLDVCGVVSFLTNTISKIFPASKLSLIDIKGTLYGLVEVTHGVKELSSAAQANIPLICGLISFSGTSIIMQSMTYLKQAKIKTHSFVLIKCVQLFLSIIICKLILLV